MPCPFAFADVAAAAGGKKDDTAGAKRCPFSSKAATAAEGEELEVGGARPAFPATAPLGAKPHHLCLSAYLPICLPVGPGRRPVRLQQRSGFLVLPGEALSSSALSRPSCPACQPHASLHAPLPLPPPPAEPDPLGGGVPGGQQAARTGGSGAGGSAPPPPSPRVFPALICP
jgi:hypothetical protein